MIPASYILVILVFSNSLFEWCNSLCFTTYPTNMPKRFSSTNMLCTNTTAEISRHHNITPLFPIHLERLRIPIEQAPHVEFAAVFYNVQPMFTIAMPLFNAQNMVFKSLRNVMNMTTSTWSLDIVVDACTDDTNLTVYHSLHRLIGRLQRSLSSNCAALCSNRTGSCSRLGFPTRLRVIVAPTPLYECKAENLVYRANDPLWSYLSVQPDQLVLQLAWNVHMALPLRLWNDVISASASCAHNVFKYRGDSSLRGIGPKCNENNGSSVSFSGGGIGGGGGGGTGRDVVSGGASLGGGGGASRLALHVRESSNRGPLTFDAKKLQAMRFLDERNFILSNDDHDLHLRAYGEQRWVTGYWPLEWREQLADKDKDRTLSPVLHATAINVSEQIMRAFIANRDGGYARWRFRGHKPAVRRPNAGKVNTTRYREHTRIMSEDDARRLHASCDELLYSQMASLCGCGVRVVERGRRR